MLDVASCVGKVWFVRIRRAEDDLRLAAAFGLSEAQHTMMCELEQAVNTDANVADELRRRCVRNAMLRQSTFEALVSSVACDVASCKSVIRSQPAAYHRHSLGWPR